MAAFGVRFLLCNLLISALIGLFLASRHFFKNLLSGRMRYNLWFAVLVFLAAPFLPGRPASEGLLRLFSLFAGLAGGSSANQTLQLQAVTGRVYEKSAGWMNDFAISVSRGTHSFAELLLSAVWMAGMLVMVMAAAGSAGKLSRLKRSALPLQNSKVKALYDGCLREMKIRRKIPLYSTAFLKSPVIAGLFMPRIYLPLRLISDFSEQDAASLRYMLLHELQHYRHRDALAGYLMNLAEIVYWFNPVVRYALREMRTDREVACDTSVLRMLDSESYGEYGRTLLRLAETLSSAPFPFAAGMGGSLRQLKRRILNIASYQPPSPGKRLLGRVVCVITALPLFCLAPFLSVCAAKKEYSPLPQGKDAVAYADFSSYFEGCDGSFVLYDPDASSFTVYNRDSALLRVSPDSTYKIYGALLGLESGVITPERSHMDWDGETFPIGSWNAGQDLRSAMQNSVNWYFQSIEEQAGSQAMSDFLRKIGYGNQNLTGGPSPCWLESTLKISPMEQVRLLQKFHDNTFRLSPENILAVKDSIRLASSPDSSLYGKTGTGRVGGQNVNGWFVGFVEDSGPSGHVRYFAANIRDEADADGAKASRIALSILSDLGVLKPIS